MQRASGRIEDVRRALVTRWAVLTLAVAALALLLVPLCTDEMSTGAMLASGSTAEAAAAGHPHTAMPILAPPTECAAPVSEPVPACAAAAAHAPATGLPAPGVDQIVLACVAVLVAVLVAALGHRAPRGWFGVAMPSAPRLGWTRLGLPAPRPELARLCVLRT